MKDELELAQRAYDLVVNFLVNYSFQLIGAMLILIAGFVVASWSSRALLVFQERRNVDVTLRQFIANAVKLLVIGLFVIIAVSKIGISITPLIAAVGGLAVGASLAIQGPLSNYGAGLVIILTRMFKVGDSITVQGCSGVVREITLATTQLGAEDGESIVIPNKHIVGEIHRNSFSNRLVEGTVGIAHADEPEAAIAIIQRELAQVEGVMQQPPPQIGIEAFRDLAIGIAYRYSVPAQRYFEIQYAVNLAVFKALAEAGIRLPTPPRDMRSL